VPTAPNGGSARVYFGPYRAVAVPTIMGVHRKMASVVCIFIQVTPNQQHSHMPHVAPHG
jgi:hypothetical protein